MQQSVVLYDWDCNFCMVIAAAILDWDRRDRLRAVAIQDEEGQRLLPGLTPEQRLESFHVVEPDGTVLSGGAALPRLCELLPGALPLKLAFEAIPRVTDSGYRWVARNRITLSKGVPGGLKAKARARLRPR